MCVVMVSRTTDTESLLHDRDCPQANLASRGQVCDSHHPTRGYLHSYLFIGASLQKNKLQEVNAEVNLSWLAACLDYYSLHMGI
jgi:hypothetical protein